MLIVDTTMKYKHQLVKIDKKNSKQPAGNLKPHAKFFWNKFPLRTCVYCTQLSKG